MVWVFFIVVAVLVVAVFAALLAGRIGYDPMAPPTASQPDPGLGEHFTAADVAGVRFDTALRGYRMDQVDEVLHRLQVRLAEQERELAAGGMPAARRASDPTPGADAGPASEPGA